MNGMIFDVGSPATCEPLTCTRPLAQCLVANRPLVDLQTERIEAAGFADRDTRTLRCFYRGDAWLSEADLTTLRTAQVETAIVTPEGNTLAHVGTQPRVSPTAEVIPAGEGSFRIRYSWDFLRVNDILVSALTQSAIEADACESLRIEGVLVAGNGTRILPGVFVEGNVLIGNDCKIGPNCYLRGNTSIGDGCHIGQAVEIKNSILMSGTSIGHLSYCGDSVVGENVNWGAGTVVANLRHDGSNHWSMVGNERVDTGRRKLGTIMGDDVHTGIHTSIYPGRKFWPHTCTRPAAVVSKDVHGS